MGEAPRYRNRLRYFVSRKLGRCRRCIQASAVITLVSWAVVAVMWIVSSTPIALRLGLLVAVSLTSLMVAHLAAIIARATTLHKEVSRELGMGRGEALLSLSRVALGAAIFGFGIILDACSTTSLANLPISGGGRNAALGGPGSSPSATPSPDPSVCCEGLHSVSITVGPVTVCAKNEADAIAAASPLLAADPAGNATAKARCEEISPTSVCRKCKFVGKVVAGTSCATDNKKCTPPQTGKKEWFCTALIIQIRCTCG